MADALGAGAVGIGQVGDGELAFFSKTGVAVSAEFFLPVPHLVAQGRLVAKFVVQTDFYDAVDVPQAFLQLKCRVAQQAALKGGDDLQLTQACPARPANGQHKRKSEFGAVVCIELLDLGELVWRAIGQPRFALLVRGFGGQGVADHGLACQFRVGENEL